MKLIIHQPVVFMAILVSFLVFNFDGGIFLSEIGQCKLHPISSKNHRNVLSCRMAQGGWFAYLCSPIYVQSDARTLDTLDLDRDIQNP